MMQNSNNPRPSRKMSLMQRIGLIVLVGTSVIPAMLITGSLIIDPSAIHVSFGIWLIIAIVGGALGGLLMVTNRKYWHIGLIAGLLLGPGILATSYYYTLLRQELRSFEIFVPIVIGSLPGFIFLYLVADYFQKKDRLVTAAPVDQNIQADSQSQPSEDQTQSPQTS